MNLSPFWSCILRNCSTWGILWVQKIRASSLYFILSVDIFSLHSIYLHSRKKHPNGEPGSPRKEEKTLRFVFCCHHLKRKTSCFVCFQGMLALSFTGNMAGERPSHGRLPTLDKFTQGSVRPPRISVSAVSSWSSVSCKLTDAVGRFHRDMWQDEI